MTWLSMIGSTLYYLVLPVSYILSWLLAILKTSLVPLLLLGSSIISGLLLPLKVLAKFEASYEQSSIAGSLQLTFYRPFSYF